MKNSKITRREKEVLELISHAYSTSEIADILYISTETAKTHRKSLLAKLGARNAAGLTRLGFELGILKLNHSVQLRIAN